MKLKIWQGSSILLIILRNACFFLLVVVREDESGETIKLIHVGKQVISTKGESVDVIEMVVVFCMTNH